jgi:hypothetical protein
MNGPARDEFELAPSTCCFEDADPADTEAKTNSKEIADVEAKPPIA